jgi:hypothetical protein
LHSLTARVQPRDLEATPRFVRADVIILHIGSDRN